MMISIKDQAYEKSPGYGIAMAFAFSNCLLNAKNIIVSGSEALYNMNSLLNNLVIMISLLAYMWAIFFVDKRGRIKLNQMVIIFLLLAFWGVSYLLNTSLFTYSYVVEEFKAFIIYSLPALIVIPLQRDCNALVHGFQKYKWIVFWVTVITVGLMLLNGKIVTSGTRHEMYSMSFGRAVLLPCLLFYMEWFETKKKVSFLCAIFCTMAIFLFGSRFPILCIAMYLVWKTLLTKLTAKKVALLIGSAFLFLIIFINLDYFIQTASNILMQFGINSRALTLLATSKFGYDDGRLAIYSELIKATNESPIIGYGAGGANIVLNNGLSHNFFLDLFANLGYIVGGIIVLISCISIFRLYKNNKGGTNREMIIFCLCMFLPTSLIQTSLWRATYFWYLIALAISKMIYINMPLEDEVNVEQIKKNDHKSVSYTNVYM